VGQGRTVLVTGAGGFIGSALVKVIAQSGCERLILLDSSANALFDIDRKISACPKMRFDAVVGSVSDAALMDNVLRQYRPDLIFHAAALKHVVMAERNPIAAVRDNAMGTYVVARSAARLSGAKLVLVSTDKAVNPHSIMGASKRVAELVVISHDTSGCKMNCVRLGNIIGSTGSVVPHFLDQISAGDPLTLTHGDASRYFMTLSAAVDSILLASASEAHGKVLVPFMSEPVRVREVADFLLRRLGKNGSATNIIGLRPGEKMSEQLMLPTEVSEQVVFDRLRVLRSRAIPMGELETVMARIANAIAVYDLAGVLDGIECIVPEYVPSVEVLRAMEQGSAVR
jgi:FlaA1/EpsC-like NDP-sugar epimerase